MRRMIPTLAIQLSLSGCLVFPHSVLAGPEVRGVLRSGGAPVAGATVFLARGSMGGPPHACAPVKTAVTSDAAGRFTIPAPRMHETIVWLIPMHTAYFWDVCAVAGGDTTYLRSAFEYGPSGMHRTVLIDCDLQPAPRDSTIARRADDDGPCDRQQRIDREKKAPVDG
jgi:hypothetical protein